MLRLINEGVDLHRATAGYVLNALPAGVPVQQYLAELDRWVQGVTLAQRQSGKAFNFGFLFGMREAKFMEQAKREYGVILTPAQATAGRNGYFTLYPDLNAWHDDAWRWVQLGYVDTPLGRRRPLVLTESEDELGLQRKAINTPVQATANDLSLMGMYESDRAIMAEGLAERALLIGFIHDAVLLEVRDEVVEPVWDIVKYHMENPPLHRLGVTLPVPLVADRKVGQTWAS
jgi:DNA polymerase I-like protein with 3'-5' exonuclease and polymerase domains